MLVAIDMCRASAFCSPPGILYFKERPYLYWDSALVLYCNPGRPRENAADSSTTCRVSRFDFRAAPLRAYPLGTLRAAGYLIQALRRRRREVKRELIEDPTAVGAQEFEV